MTTTFYAIFNDEFTALENWREQSYGSIDATFSIVGDRLRISCDKANHGRGIAERDLADYVSLDRPIRIETEMYDLDPSGYNDGHGGLYAGTDLHGAGRDGYEHKIYTHYLNQTQLREYTSGSTTLLDTDAGLAALPRLARIYYNPSTSGVTINVDDDTVSRDIDPGEMGCYYSDDDGATWTLLDTIRTSRVISIIGPGLDNYSGGSPPATDPHVDFEYFKLEGTDIDGPTITHDPTDKTVNVNIDGTVTVDCVDAESGVSAAATVITIDGATAWTGDAQQSGFTVAKSSITNGLRYSITKDSNWTYGQTLDLTAYSEDVAGNDTTSTVQYAVELEKRTLVEERADSANKPFYFVHIEGFADLWFTVVPDEWTAPTDWTYQSGLMLQPGNGYEANYELNTLSGITDPDSINFIIAGTTIEQYASNKRNGSDETTLLITNDIVHGDNSNIVLDNEPSNFDTSDGTVYIGNQTVTYSSLSSSTLSGVDRGRYFGLDEDFNEIKWPSRIVWDDKLNINPRVTLFPRSMHGRTVTIWRNYFDKRTGEALPIDESEVRFRGTIEAYGDDAEHLAIDFNAVNYLDKLNRNICRDLPRAPLLGVHIPDHIYHDSEYATALKFKYAYSGYNSSDNTMSDIIDDTQYSFAVKHVTVNIGSLVSYTTIDDLIKALNDRMKEMFDDGDLDYDIFFVRRDEDGKGVFGYDAIGYTTIGGLWPPAILAKGSTTAFDGGIRCQLQMNEVASALGFGDPTHEYVEVGEFEADLYLDAFAKWTNPTYYSSYIKGPDYIPIQTVSEDPIPRAWFYIDRGNRIPIDIDAANNNFVTSFNDDAEFLVLVDGAMIAPATSVNTTDEYIVASLEYGYRYPIGTTKKPEDSYISVPFDADPAETHNAQQVYKPTGQYVKTVDTDATRESEGLQHLLLSAMVSTGVDEDNGLWDKWPGGFGLEIYEGYVDTQSFEILGDIYGSAAMKREYYFTEEQRFWDLLENEAKTMGFVVTLNEGKITCVPYENPTTKNAAYTIDDSVRVKDTDVEFVADSDGIFNTLKISADYDVIDDSFLLDELVVDLASEVDYHVRNELAVENKGIRTRNFNTSNTNTTINEVNSILTDRLNDVSQEVYHYTCVVDRSIDRIAIGDNVLVTDTRVLNPRTGTRGIVNHPGRVIRASFDDFEGQGEIVIRLPYFDDIRMFDNQSINQDAINAAKLGPTFKPSSIIDTKINLTFDFGQKNMDQVTDLSQYDLIHIRDMRSGETYNREVVSFDRNSAELVIDQNLGFDSLDLDQSVISYSKYSTVDDNTVTGNETKVAYIANSSGIIVDGGTKLGWKIL